MFWGFCLLLPGQVYDPLGRGAALFAAAWIGWLMLIDVALLGIMERAAGGVVVTTLLVARVAL